MARTLLGWGFQTISFVDNGRVSYSNPVRQPLYEFSDCVGDDDTHGRARYKAVAAAAAMKRINPSCTAMGNVVGVPMPGHCSSDEVRRRIRECIPVYQVLVCVIRDAWRLPLVLSLRFDNCRF